MVQTKEHDEKSVFEGGNELKANFLQWGKIGDHVFGTLVRVYESKDKYNEGEMKKNYELKAKFGMFNEMEDKKLTGNIIIINAGDIWTVGSRSKAFDNKLANVKIGQMIGFKFLEEYEGEMGTGKTIKIHAPKNKAGQPEMDEKFLAEQDETANL